MELVEHFPSLAFRFVVMFLGWLYLSGLTVILYLTLNQGVSVLIRDTLMILEVPMLIIVLAGLGLMMLKTFRSMMREYWRIIRS